MLDDLIARVEAGEVTAEDAAAEAPLHRGDTVAVTIYLSRNVDGVVRFLQDNGVSPRNVGEDYIEAFIPILLLPQISEQQGVLRVEEAIPAEPFQGGARISGNGPAVHGSPAWNQDGYRGQGIKVGIIDNGFEGFSGLMGTELPQSVRARCYPVVKDSDAPTDEITDCAWNGSHGTAVAESVMDIAPDVSLYVANALSKGDLQAAVQWMIDQGVNVINHSVGWPFDGPGDGTSPNSWSPLRSVDRAVDSGIVWVNAAGNDARTTWFGPPSDADEDGAIEFAAEDERNGFVLSCDVTRCALRIQLRWDDSWDGAVRDLDLYIYDLDDNIELRSEREQSGSNGHAPFESIYAKGSGAFYIGIVNRSGSLPSWIQLTLWGNVVVEHYTETGSVTNPAESANPGLLTVGAARWSNVSSIESFSSLGPTPDGRIKPDVVGADCGEVKSYPEVIAGCWFPGTSQASPHVAGMAALVRQRFPDYTPAQVVSYLKENAEQRINSPDPNNTWGHGFTVLPPITTDVASISDLVVDTPTVDTSAPAAGARFTLSATVRNQGNGASDSTTLRYYVSTDSTITNGDTEVGTDSVSGLDASESGDGSISLTAPSTPGTYYFGACVDSVSDESDTTNNCSPAVTATVGAAPAPDLVVNVPTVSESAPAAGATLTLSASVRNQGNGRSDSTTLRYYVSTDSTITNGDAEVGTDSVFRLDASESGDESISLDAPSIAGTYYYGVCVDALSDESDTTNNCSPAVTVTVGAAPAPDLVVDAPTVDTSAPAAGARFTLNATVRNQGNGRSDSTTLRYYVSTDSTITTGDTEVGTDLVSGLGASASGDESVSLTAPSTPGTYYFGACADSVSDESDTTNNCSAAVTVTVGAAPAPDLVVDTPTVDTSAPAAGARFTLNATMRNQGNGRSDSTTLRYYQSSDPTITTGDTEVGTDFVSRLDASESGDESIRLDAPSTPGTHYYGACVEAVSGESDTTNNCSPAVTVTVGAAPAPDLVVDTPTVSESAPAAGARFTLNATVRNQGAARSNSTTLRYYQSSDATITIGDTEVGTDSVFGLSASWSGDESVSLDAPSTPGTYYYGACVDAVSDESDTTNNCSAAVTVTVGAAPAPDLVVDTPAVSESTPAAGARFTLNATVRNQGNGPSAFTRLRYYQSSDPTITTGDTEVGTDSVFWLDPSGSGDESVSLTAPSSPDTYYYGACVDEVNGELDTQNNCSPAVTVTVGAAPAPDLVVDTPTVDTSALAAGARFTLNATVRNQGNGRSNSTTLRYYQSNDPTITTGDRSVGTDSVFWLDPSESGDESVSLDAPSTPGTYYYGACVDALSDESDTTNNCSPAVTVTVGAAPAPDLVVDTPTVSESAPAAGARFTLSATVRNQGAARSNSTTLRYYQSADPTITSGDTEVGTDSVFGLGASASGDESVSLTAPDMPGTYYYGACVDALSNESDTTNNCSPAVTVTVGAAPAPDLVVDTPTVSESAPSAGASFTLSATVRNQGAARSDSTTLRYYQSTDSTMTSADTEVGTDSVFGLAASRSGDESVSLTAASIAGTYYYGACIDEVNGELDTANNCSAAVTVTVGAAPAPDLVVDTPTVSDSAPAAGASFTLSATVRNQGAARSASTTLRYYQSADATMTSGDTEVGTDSVFGLGASASGDESISLTAPSTPGTYYYGACVDVVSEETDATNNCSAAVAVSVGAAPAPDLVVDTPAVSESAPAAGASFTLSTTVRNQGAARSASTTLRYYQSTDSTMTSGDAEVGTDSVFGLGASASGDESISLTAPDMPGTYYYGACVDSVSDESDATNNCSAAVTVTVGAAPAPDLVVDAPTVSESAPAAGASFTLSATVRNQGAARSASTTLRYYQSTDSTMTSGDTEVGTDSVFGLAASASGDESISLTAPDTPGTYYYGACVEAVSDESDTTNNCSSAVTVTVSSGNTYGVGDFLPGVPTSGLFIPAVVSGASLSSSGGNTTITFTNGGYIGLQDGTRFTCQSTGGCGVHNGQVTQGTIVGESTSVSTSDLIVDPPTVSESAPAAGARFTLSATVRNQGSGASAFTTLRYYQSTDSTITSGDTEAGTDSVSSLGASRSGDESVSLTAPSTPGTYYYGACVDALSDESDTTNNCSAAVTVVVDAAPAPDLTVSIFTAENSSPVTGQYFTVNATVNNQGNGSSRSTTLRYYRSTDATITTSDAIVPTAGIPGFLSVGVLSPSGSEAKTARTSAPYTLGTYYYGACVDAVTGESDTTNNCSAAVTVTVQRTNRSPQLTGEVDDMVVVLGESFTVDLSGLFTDPDGDEITSYGFSYSTSGILAGSVNTRTGILSLSAIAVGETIVAVGARDSNGQSGDSEDLFKVTVVAGAAPAPDLVVDTPTVSDSSPNAGASLTLSATVRNQGNGSSSSTTLRYYRSTDATITTSDTEVGTDPVLGLSASGSSDESIGLTAQSDPGVYYYGACVDVVSSESETTNNCSASVQVTVPAPTTAPDLALRHFSAEGPTTGRNSKIEGASFHLYAQVHNIGTAASTATTLRYYRSADSTITASDTEVGTGSVIALRPRGLLTGSNISVTAPGPPDIYYYAVCVDSVSNESDTTNNCSTAVEITVLAPPDMVVDTPEVGGQIGQSPVTLRHGQSFDLYARVRNQGNDVVYLTALHYYLSTDATITTSDTVVGTKNLAGGPPTRISLTAPETSGTYYYGACADSILLESDTSNNCSDSLQVIVEPPPAPDLVVDTPTVSYVYVSSLTAGDTFTLSFTVRNQGNRSSGPITLRYYRSGDAEFDDDDTLVASATESQVYYGGERNLTSERIIAHVFFAPSGDGRSEYRYISDETYYYIVCVDPVSGESDTTNNCSGGVAVTATSLTTSTACIVGYVLTPSDECAHKVQGKFDVIYGEVDAFNSGLGFIYYDFGPLETMTRSVSGSGPGNRQTTVHIVNWAD